MKICSKKDIKVMTGVLAASMLLGGCTVTTDTSSTEIKNDPKAKTAVNLNEVRTADYDQELMDEEYRRYCFDLLSRTVKDYGSESNVMISPASVMIALDMVAAGAKNDSLRQLTDLFAAGQGPLTQQAYAADLMEKINTAKEVEFSCANAVWSNRTILGDEVNLEYIEYLQDTFNAEYNVREFDEKTPGEINKWVDEHTDHMIEKVISGLDPSTVMVLVNAIAFDGKWAEPYEETQVTEGRFTDWDGSVQNVNLLHSTESVYFESDKATGFMKAYEGGQYSFLAILPSDDSVSANGFASSFTASDYEDFIGSAEYGYEVITVMPEFESDFEMLLNDTLENLGAGDIFHSETADLSGIAGDPGDIYVSKVIHKTHIEVNAKGTRAAAVTAVTLDCGAAMPLEQEPHLVICDRPFVYAIVDNATMAPVFIGTVNAV